MLPILTLSRYVIPVARRQRQQERADRSGLPPAAPKDEGSVGRATQRLPGSAEPPARRHQDIRRRRASQHQEPCQHTHHREGDELTN